MKTHIVNLPNGHFVKMAGQTVTPVSSRDQATTFTEQSAKELAEALGGGFQPLEIEEPKRRRRPAGEQPELVTE